MFNSDFVCLLRIVERMRFDSVLPIKDTNE